MAGTILDTIVETKRREVAEAVRTYPLAEIRRLAEREAPPRDVYAAVTAGRVMPGAAPVRLIAEIKKSSPSAGLIRSDFDPVAIARVYEGSGAAALSVLTDRAWFSGELSFLRAVKAAVGLPALRKDFIVDEYQVWESRAAGADAILLIAAVMTLEQIAAWAGLAGRLGMTTLVEVHTLEELRTMRQVAGPRGRVLLGINNRDLHAQRTDLDTTVRLAGELHGLPFVSESGIRTAEDVSRLHAAGATALLIGETFMRSPDIAGKIGEMFR